VTQERGSTRMLVEPSITSAKSAMMDVSRGVERASCVPEIFFCLKKELDISVIAVSKQELLGGCICIEWNTNCPTRCLDNKQRSADVGLHDDINGIKFLNSLLLRSLIR